MPLVLLILSNEYKGDNITRLTLEPSLVPFDTFSSLVQNNFSIYSRRYKLPSETYRHLKGNSKLKQDYIQYSEHEFYPIVSELWFQVIKLFSFSYMTILDSLIRNLPNSTQHYLNNTKMLPSWKEQNGDHGSGETVLQVLDMHMKSCDKSAIVADENFAIQLYTILMSLQSPVYFGKDIVNENLEGYKYYGYFPTSLMLRVKYSFQNGVVEWWENYFKWIVKLKTELEYKNFISAKNGTYKSSSKAGIYVLSLIPGTGLLLSLFVFVFMDSNIVKYFYRKSRETIFKSLNWKCSQGSIEVAKSYDGTSCPFCENLNENTTFSNILDLKAHLMNIHTECAFLNLVVPREKLSQLHDLSNIVMSAEVESTVSTGERQSSRISSKIACPYKCAEFENLQDFKDHLLVYHKDTLMDKLANLLKLASN